MPWRIEDEVRKLGANYIQAGPFRSFAIRDGNLVTGRQNFSGAETVRLILEARRPLTRRAAVGIESRQQQRGPARLPPARLKTLFSIATLPTVTYLRASRAATLPEVGDSEVEQPFAADRRPGATGR